MQMKDKQRIKRSKASLRDISYIALSCLVLASIIGNLNFKTTVARANELLNNPPVETQIIERSVIKDDSRIVRLKAYLNSKHSPLAPYSEVIVSEADKYAVDYTKIVAISAIESDFGKKLPNGSHNAWGLGGSKFMYFTSWEEGIGYMSKLIGTSYKHNENAGIKSKYCPESDNCNPNWSNIVTNTSKEILAMEGNK
jgi:hypothetical protein